MTKLTESGYSLKYLENTVELIKQFENFDCKNLKVVYIASDDGDTTLKSRYDSRGSKCIKSLESLEEFLESLSSELIFSEDSDDISEEYGGGISEIYTEFGVPIFFDVNEYEDRPCYSVIIDVSKIDENKVKDIITAKLSSIIETPFEVYLDDIN